jgi:hypothetical protein
VVISYTTSRDVARPPGFLRLLLVHRERAGRDLLVAGSTLLLLNEGLANFKAKWDTQARTLLRRTKSGKRPRGAGVPDVADGG